MNQPVSFSRLLALRRGPYVAGRTSDDATSRVAGPAMTLDRKAFIDIISEGEDKAAGIMPPPDGGWA